MLINHCHWTDSGEVGVRQAAAAAKPRRHIVLAGSRMRGRCGHPQAMQQHFQRLVACHANVHLHTRQVGHVGAVDSCNGGIRAYNAFSRKQSHAPVCLHAVEDVQQSDAELHFCPFANRQLVIVHTEPGTQLPEELDSAARLRAEEQATAKLAQVPDHWQAHTSPLIASSG